MGQDDSSVSVGTGRKKSNDTKATTHLFPPADWCPAGLQAKATLARLLLVSMMLYGMEHHYCEESALFSSQTQFNLILISFHSLGDVSFLVLCSFLLPSTEDTWLNARFHFTEWREMGTPRLNAKAGQETGSVTCYLLWLLAYIG